MAWTIAVSDGPLGGQLSVYADDGRQIANWPIGSASGVRRVKSKIASIGTADPLAPGRRLIEPSDLETLYDPVGPRLNIEGETFVLDFEMGRLIRP